MTKKQKKVLRRIIISAVLLVAMAVTFTVLDKTGMVDLENPSVMWRCIEIVAYLIPYLVIGYDILKKAFLGIIHGEVFDENFLMAIATVGAMVLGEYKEASAVMLFYQIGELRRRQEQEEYHSTHGYPSGLCQHREGWQAGTG